MDNKLEQTMLQGLTEQEARERLAADGNNELPTAKKRTVFHVLFEVVSIAATGLVSVLLAESTKLKPIQRLILPK